MKLIQKSKFLTKFVNNVNKCLHSNNQENIRNLEQKVEIIS
jgi:hypothetical protein